MVGKEFRFEKSGRGEPLLFLNASGLRDYYWASQRDFFSNRFEVFVLAGQGFGAAVDPGAESTRDFPASLEEHAKYVLDFIVSQNLKRVHLVGHSFGGLVALNCVFQKPGLFSTLHLVEPDSLFLDDGERKILARVLKLRGQSFQENILAYVQRTSCHWLPEPFQRMVLEDTRDNSVCYRGIFSVLAETRHDMAEIEERLLEVPCPVALVYGGRNHGSEASKRLEDNRFDLFPRCRFDILENCGHNPMLENPTLFNQVLEHSLAIPKTAFSLNRWT